MRAVTISNMPVAQALQEIERASHDADLVEIAQNFSVDTPAFTPTYTINTVSPSAANIANFLATLIGIMQRGGLNRTT